MKKIISLLLVLMMLVSLAPAAFADGGDSGSGAGTAISLEDALIKLLRVYGCEDAGEGIFQEDGHLVSCSGENCQCLAVLYATVRDDIAAKKVQDLQVWYRSSRDADDQRHDTVVAELERPYKASKVEDNEEYLAGKKAVAERLEQFANDDLADMLYRPSEFIHGQTMNSLDYAVKEFGSQLHVEYMLMADGVNPLYGYGIGLVEEGSDKGAAEHFALSRDVIAEETPEHDLFVRAGNILIALPESCTDKAFSLGLSYYENGAVRIMLIDDAGNAIPGAVISTVLPEGVAKAAVMDDAGKLEAIDSEADGGVIAFTAPTGDDVFALTK